jgi:hypothetical protein
MLLISRISRARSLAWIGLACTGVLIAGCGDGKIARYPVQGTVNVDGKPASGAIVIFCPTSGGPELEKLRPMGTADASGVFKLMSIKPNDGAPAGQYKIIVKWPAQVSATADREGRGGNIGPDRLRGKYYNVDTTPLSATIEAKSNELAPFDLQTK